METGAAVQTGTAALLFAAMFLLGDRVHPLRAFVRDRRSIISFCAGMTAAYVFVHLLPELHAARQSFAKSMRMFLRYDGMAIYFLALVGFLMFYGLDYLRGLLRESADPQRVKWAFWIHLGGFATYVGLMAYLLVHRLEEGTTEQLLLYTAAIAVHLLTVDHALREEYAARYQKMGRFVLSTSSLVGWAAGLVVVLPLYVLAPLVAFISGSVIMNSLITELPADKDGRFLPFVTGGLTYGLVLIPLS